MWKIEKNVKLLIKMWKIDLGSYTKEETLYLIPQQIECVSYFYFPH